MRQLDFSVFDDILDIVFGSRASGCGEQSIALARICDVGAGGGVLVPIWPIIQQDITCSWHWRLYLKALCNLLFDDFT